MTSGVAAAFVGRERELALLEQAWARATQGVGGLVLICGEPGMGKSRLVEHVVERRREDGQTVWVGQCWEAGGAPSYWPWTQALRSLVRGLGEDRLRERLGPRVAALRAVLPELARDASPTGASDDPKQARFQVFDAVGELLTEAAFEAPVGIVLEDLHAADEGSLQMLEFVARATPALIIGTYREREAARRAHASSLVRIARRATLVELGPLDESAIAELLVAAWGAAPEPELVTQLVDVSEGNPLFVAELARRWRSSPAGRKAERIEVPLGIEATIAEHLVELDQRSREILEAASVLGRDFEVGMLARLVESSDDELLSHLGQATHVDLLRAIGPGAYRFAHFMHRAVIYQAIPVSRRSALHLRATEILLETSSPTARPWSVLAHHYFEAGHLARDQAVEAATEAARVASRRRAFGDAAALYRRACDVLQTMSEVGSPRHLELLLGLAQAEIDAGATRDGKQTCEVVIDLARALDDAVALARAVSIYGSVFVLGVVDPRLVALLEEGLAALGDRDPRLRAQLLARYAAALQPAPDPRRPIAIAREALALARASADQRTLLITIRNAVSAMMDLGDPVERIVLDQEHIDLAVELGEPSEAIRGHLRAAMDALELPALVRADGHLEAMSRIADELALPHYQALACGMRAARARMEGRFNTAKRWSEQMRVLVERTRDATLEETFLLHELGALRTENQHDTVLARLDQVRPVPFPEAWWRVFALALRASTLVRVGRVSESLAVLSPTEIRLLLLGGDPMTICCVGEWAAATENRELAARVHEVLKPRRGRCVSWGVLGLNWDGPIDRVLGLLESCLGETDAARRSFEAAIDLCRRLEVTVHLDRAEQDFARAFGLDGNEPMPEPRVELPTPARPTRASLRREGETWTLVGREPPIYFKDTRGMGMLARLLDEPGRELHVLDLSGSAGATASDAGPVLDDRARTEYRRRAEHLRTELAEAEAWNDTARAERARQELEVLSRELARAVGLGGRGRAARSTVERARVNVQRRIRDAIRRIGEQDETWGRHLSRSVRTGAYCAYEPD